VLADITVLERYVIGPVGTPARPASTRIKSNTFLSLAFSTNDEHATKRVSDAFCTATELRDEELRWASPFALARPSDGDRNEKPDRSAHMRITVRLLASLNHIKLRQYRLAIAKPRTRLDVFQQRYCVSVKATSFSSCRSSSLLSLPSSPS
jgi:hypothetical protein